MSDQTELERITLETFKKALADLRRAVSAFQENIEEYLTAVEDLWREVKSHLSSIEARLAAMEVQLSAMPPGEQFQPEKLDSMLKDVKEVSDDLTKMRQRFHAFAEVTLQRVN